MADETARDPEPERRPPADAPDASFWQKLNPTNWKSMLAPYWSEADKAAALPEVTQAAEAPGRIHDWWREYASQDPLGITTAKQDQADLETAIQTGVVPAGYNERMARQMAGGGPISLGAPGGFAGAIRHVQRPIGTPTRGTTHSFEWAPSEQQLLPKSQPELTLSGTTYATNPEDLQGIMFSASPKPGSAGREMTKIGWEKLNQFYRELHDLFQKHGIERGTFLPSEGQMGRGPDVPAEVRKRAFERMAGSKAKPMLEPTAEGEYAHTGDYLLDFGPPKLGPPPPEAATAPTVAPRRPAAARRSPTTEVRRPTPEELQAAKDQANAEARNAAMHAQIDATRQARADAALGPGRGYINTPEGIRLSPPSPMRRNE